MDRSMKVMFEKTHLRFIIILVLSVGSLAVGFVAGNRGGDGNVFIPPDDNIAIFQDRNFNGLEDRFVVCLDGVPVEAIDYGAWPTTWFVESWNLVELTSGALSVQFQENQDGKWIIIDEMLLQWEIVESDADVFNGQIPQSYVDGMCLAPGNDNHPPYTFALFIDEIMPSYNTPEHFFGGNARFGILNFQLMLAGEGAMGCEFFPSSSMFMPIHTNLPNPEYLANDNRYSINALNQQVDLLWDYINALEKCATDVNRDTVVDVTDLLEVVADWGSICETPKGK